MAISPAQFARRMRRRADNAPNVINEVVKAVGRAVTVTTIDFTPVDTGEARSNWLVTIGLPTDTVIAPHSPYPKFSRGNGQGRSERANAVAAKSRALAVIASRRPGQDLIVQNNVDHIQELNSGTSSQAPAMFVEMAVMSGIRALNGTKLKV